MKLDDSSVLAALRQTRPIGEVCAAAGVGEADFLAARDAFLKRHATLTDQTIKAAVGGRVEILRDRAGVPHVYAAATADLYFGLGVAMAQDRLWQMDRLRRRALGRQAEILGAAYVNYDIAHLTVGIDEISAREPDLMDGATRDIVSAMVAGINRQIEAFGADLPIEFRVLDYVPEKFTLRDVVAIGRGIWWSLNGRIDRIVAAEAARLLPSELRARYLTPEASENVVLPWATNPPAGPLDAMQTPVFTGTDDATGSNNWALGANRTGTGHALLCGDPHQPFWVPSSWYEFALHGPEDDVAGAGHPGLPGLWWGSNGDAAWCITNNAASTRDLFREQVAPNDPGSYRDGSVWRKFAERHTNIAVRGEAARKLTIRSTVRGPIINDLVTRLDAAGDPPLSLRWVGMEHIDDFRAAIGIGRARDWPAFRGALRDWAIAVFNFVYADKSGRVGYQMAGRVPVRGRIVPGLRDANEKQDEWRGYVPYDALPSSFDPAGGYVASANQRIVGADYSFPIYGAYSQGHRGVRLAGKLGGPGKVDKAASIALQHDVKNLRAEQRVPQILSRLDRQDASLADFVAPLAAWDFHYRKDTAAPTIFETFMAIWQRTVLGVHLPERLLDLTSQQTGLAMDILQGDVEDYFTAGTKATVAEVARRALAVLRERLGSDVAAWQWGRVHQAHWRHVLSNPANGTAFDIGPMAVDGGSHTIRNTGGELPPHAATSGAEYRMVVDFAAPDSFQAVQNIGNSGVPGSPHYMDQFEPWVRGEYHTVHLKRAAVQAECQTTTRIEPKT